LWACQALAQANYPARPVRIIVPSPPAGGTDIIARVLAQYFSNATGQQFYVENRAGAGNMIGIESVARAAPDGYTLLHVTTATFVTTPIFSRTPSYDPLSSFVPVTLLSSMAAVIVVNPSLPARTLQELTALVKASPGRYRYATAGSGSLSFLAGELFKSQTQLDVKEVQAKGPIAAAQSVASGGADMMFDLAVFFVPGAREGKLRPLATMASGRIPQFSEVPSTTEAGMPDLIAYSWSGLVAPFGTPPETVDVINRAAQAVLAEIETQATFQRYGLVAEGSSPGEFHRIIRAELTKWARALPLSATSQ